MHVGLTNEGGNVGAEFVPSNGPLFDQISYAALLNANLSLTSNLSSLSALMSLMVKRPLSTHTLSLSALMSRQCGA